MLDAKDESTKTMPRITTKRTEVIPSIYSSKQDTERRVKPRSDRSYASIKISREKKKSTDLHYFREMQRFSDSMQIAQKRRGKLGLQVENMTERRTQYGKLITDNMNKLRRQQQMCEDHINSQRSGEAELAAITIQIEEATKRKEKLQKDLSKLSAYETIITETIKLLPKDYVPPNTSRTDSLVYRFAMLCEMKELLLKELYEKQELTQLEFHKLSEQNVRSVDAILTSSSTLQETANHWKTEQETIQQSIEQYYREKEKTIDEFVNFVTIIRSLRNIADKAALGLHNLHTRELPNQHKTSLSANFRLIMRFLGVVSAIRDEIAPTSRKSRASIDLGRHFAFPKLSTGSKGSGRTIYSFANAGKHAEDFNKRLSTLSK